MENPKSPMTTNDPGEPKKPRSRFCTLLHHDVVDPKEFMVHFAKRRKNEIIIEGQVCGWCYNIDYLNDENTKYKKKRPKLPDGKVTKRGKTSPRGGAIADIPRHFNSSAASSRGVKTSRKRTASSGDDKTSRKRTPSSGDEKPKSHDLEDKPGDLA
ncbi:uncharacterized protein LOC6735835 [Drosophila simulans]|uniref:Uncharacterized protein n=1 Tax=Drosophila simulans TaxID=7240 RepID=A0A0J9RJG6_DROSI|nr:uncharacterized protein LOC6735835 [Drosophila simulans]KMY95986.1 uncharacterized protein Dsimw501_GD11746 [Drosophila simulans]